MDLLSSDPITIKGIGKIKSPTLRRIRAEKSRYHSYIHMLTLNPQQLISTLQLPLAEEAPVSLYDLIISDTSIRELYQKAISFFICGELHFDQDSAAWAVFETDPRKNEQPLVTGIIHRDNFNCLIRDILEMNHIDVEKQFPLVGFKNSKAREIYENIQKQKEKAKKKNEKKDKMVTLGDIISSLCVQSNSYNLINIWDLTIYQLYDQFARQNMKTQIDITGLKWAAWGSEPFDFSLWYKNLKEKN